MSARSLAIAELRLPFAITLAVTAVRLAGELLQGPSWLFGTAAGGGLSLVGIGWLVPVFGWWFARRLADDAGPRPSAWWRLAAGFAVAVATMASVQLLCDRTPMAMALGGAGAVLGGIGAFSAWPALGRRLLAYAVAARLPIAVITAVAVAGDFGTHYEKLAPGSPAMGPLPRFLILVLAQFLFWLPITVLGGMLAGLLTRDGPRQKCTMRPSCTPSTSMRPRSPLPEGAAASTKWFAVRT